MNIVWLRIGYTVCIKTLTIKNYDKRLFDLIIFKQTIPHNNVIFLCESLRVIRPIIQQSLNDPLKMGLHSFPDTVNKVVHPKLWQAFIPPFLFLQWHNNDLSPSSSTSLCSHARLHMWHLLHNYISIFQHFVVASVLGTFPTCGCFMAFFILHLSTQPCGCGHFTLIFTLMLATCAFSLTISFIFDAK